MPELTLSPRNRRCLLLTGDADWCRRAASGLVADPALQPAVWLEAGGRRLLGTETGALVVDAHAGFDPDAFGLACGTLRGGGLLVLLTPPLAHWPAFDDPQRRRLAVALQEASAVPSRFLARAARVLQTDPDVFRVQQGEALPVVVPAARSPRPPGWRSPDQQRAVEALLRVASGHRRRPLVLIADRGRGKSAAFGMAAAGLLRAGHRRVLVTAPRIDAVDALFEHAARELGVPRGGRGHLHWQDADIRFVAPDALLHDDHPADLLLVDEAAAIPAPLLAGLLRRYPRIAFATTVHGYEGTGRGFAVRFSQVLDRDTRGWKALRLETPIRWAAGDPLERLVSRLLLLDAGAADDAVLRDATPQTCTPGVLDRDRLVGDEATLRELFGLLVLAHYRTRPFDLRHMLDGINLDILVLRHRGHVAATALVAREGGFDAATADAIAAGERRPHGHLLPELLAAHLGPPDAARLRCARIVRIAVHPAVQGRGLGAQLLAFIVARAGGQGLDFIGSSFGATRGLLRFWRRGGFEPVRLGIRRGAASGEHSLVVLRGLSAPGEALADQLRSRFGRQFPAQLGDALRDVEPALVADLLHGIPAPGGLDEADRRDLRAYAHGRRRCEDCLAPLADLALAALAAGRVTEERDRVLLVARLLQKRSWREVAQRLGVPGRRQADAALRQVIAALLPRSP